MFIRSLFLMRSEKGVLSRIPRPIYPPHLPLGRSLFLLPYPSSLIPHPLISSSQLNLYFLQVFVPPKNVPSRLFLAWEEN